MPSQTPTVCIITKNKPNSPIRQHKDSLLQHYEILLIIIIYHINKISLKKLMYEVHKMTIVLVILRELVAVNLKLK